MSVPVRSLKGARLSVAGLLTIVVLGGVCLALAGFADRRTTAVSLNIPDAAPVALQPGQTACQGPISVGQPVGGVTVWATTSAGPGARLAATVRDADGGTTVARGRLAPSASDQRLGWIAVSGYFTRSFAPRRRISICLTPLTGTAVMLLGSGGNTLTINGKPTGSALAVVLRTPHPRSLISLIPTVFRRAALFHPSWMGAWTFWILAAGLAAGVALIALSLLRAEAMDEAELRNEPTVRATEPESPPFAP